jgi:DNA polymerase-3 subunit gamma/tau
MSHQVLARKWRPSDFRQLVGQEHVLRALVNALDRDRLHHAYLFTGTRGVGKTTIARIFAKCLNCDQGVSSTPCGECAACREIGEGRFIDLIEVDAASRTKVEDTRELLENVQYAPSRGRYKVYLIDEVHMLSSHSFNALLKTLEEPPPHVKFLLATTDPQKLPATVLSRCLQFNLKNMAAEGIVEHLQHVLAEEQVAFDEGALWLLAEAARGSMRDALSLTDQAIGFGAGKVVQEDVAAMLGTIDRQAVNSIIDNVLQGDGAALFARIEELAMLGTDFQALLDDLLGALHGIAVAQAVPEVASPGRVDSARTDEFARALSGEDVQLFYQMALNARRDFAYVPDPRRGFEMLALRLLAFRPVAASELATADSAARDVTPSGPPGAEVPGVKKPEAPGHGSTAAVADSSRGETSASDRKPGPEAPLSVEADAKGVNTNDQLRSVAAPAVDPGSAAHRQSPGVRAQIAAGSLDLGDGGLSLEEFSPDHWLALFRALNLSGVTRSVVSNTIVSAVEGDTLRFVLDQQQAGLYNEVHRQRLETALSEYFARKVSVSVEEGELNRESPARHQLRCKAERQQAAIEELQQDPNVKMLVKEFDARLDIDSVTPLE